MNQTVQSTKKIRDAAEFKAALDEHDRIYIETLERYALPETVLRTFDGRDLKHPTRNLFHDRWVLQTEDPNKVRAPETTITFDAVVDTGGLRLTHPWFRRDLLTKKLVVLNKLGVGLDSVALSSRASLEFSVTYDWFIRWRLAHSILDNSQLVRGDFDEFFTTLSSGEILDLIPYETRLEQILAEVDRGTRTLASLVTGSRRNFFFNWNLLATWMGVTKVSLSTSQQFRSTFLEMVEGRTDDGVDKIIEGLKARSRDDIERSDKTSNALMRYLSQLKTIDTLCASKVITHTKFSVDPFSGKSVRATAEELAARPDRTNTLHPEDFFRLLQNATQWIANYSDYIIEVAQFAYSNASNVVGSGRKAFDERLLVSPRPDGAPMVQPVWRLGAAEQMFDENGSPALPANAALHHLSAAAAIIIGGFGARRVREVESLKADCLVEENSGLWELTVYIEKTLRDIDRIPVPPIVKMAVDVLKRIVSIDGSEPEWLFVRRTANDKPQFEHITRHVRQFVLYCGLSPPEGLSSWRKLGFHQFRRAFGIAYYHGNDWAEIDPLSWMYWHLDPNMTRWYVTEAVAGQIGRLRDELEARRRLAASSMSAADVEWIRDAQVLLDDLAARRIAFSEARVEAFVRKMLSLHKGTDRAIGRGARHLYLDLAQMVEMAAADVRISTNANGEDAFDGALLKRLKTYVGTHYLEPIPGGVAHCTLESGNAVQEARANCRQIAKAAIRPWQEARDQGTRSGPDFAFSGSYPCLTCEFCAAFQSDRKRIEKRMDAIGQSRDYAATARMAAEAEFNYEQLRDALLQAEDSVSGVAS